MKIFNIPSLVLAIAATLSVTTFAQEKTVPMQLAATETKTAEMTDGEIRKVDMENKKITIKHGEIKNLDMPGMTMVFQVKEITMLDMIKVGDKVKFIAEKLGGAIVVTEIQSNK